MVWNALKRIFLKRELRRYTKCTGLIETGYKTVLYKGNIKLNIFIKTLFYNQ